MAGEPVKVFLRHALSTGIDLRRKEKEDASIVLNYLIFELIKSGPVAMDENGNLS